MAISQMSEILQHVRGAVLLRNGAGLTDGQLLEDYLSRRDEAALAALVRRHAPMVWGTCRRVLGNHHDAEDAFQATFLVFVRKAASIAARELLANWLYGVARQTALKARGTIAKRKVRERQVTEMPQPATGEQDFRDDLQPLLDQELSHLPDHYRAVVVLCELGGKTRKEAARQLGLPEGTVGSRLARARVLLAKRLARHGLVTSGGALGMVLSQTATSGAVPTSKVSKTIQAASLFAAGQRLATGVISTQVAALAEGVLKSMLLSKLKMAVVAFLVIGTLGIGVSALTRETRAADPEAGAKSGIPSRDEGNLKETVLALEKRIWDAHSKQDVEAFKNLLADDFVCMDMFGRPSDKAGELDYVERFRVIEHTMKDVKIIPLNATSAIVSYEIHYKVRPTQSQEVESTTRRVTSAWSQRKGRWWYVYFEDRLVQKKGAAWRNQDFWELKDASEILKKITADKNPLKD
jgi:RNA polymerase sigma factor (sigma-70 family)